MKIVFMGTPDFAAGILDAIVKAGYDVVGVVTQPDKPKGRRKEPVACPVKEVALREGLHYSQRDIRSAEVRLHQRACIAPPGVPRGCTHSAVHT